MSDSIQLSNRGEVPDQLYLQRGVLDVTPSAVNFRDISAADEKKERNIKIGMVIGAVILLIVTIVVVSRIAQLSPIARWVHNRSGQIFIIYEYPAFVAFVPGILGTAVVIGLALGASGVNRENNLNNGYLRALSKDGAVEHELFILTSENLENIHKNYHRRMQPLVRKGLISEDVGRQLSALLERFHEPATRKASYESHGEAFKADLTAHPKKYPAYNTLLEDIAKLEGEWKTLQQTIQEPYAQE